ncbi:MAG: ATP-binding protein [Vicinamibacterales bacterium]
MLSRTLQAPWWWQATTAIGSAAGAFLLTLLLELSDRPFLIPLIAVLLAASRGGFAAGALCTAVTILVVNYFFTPPPDAFGVPSPADAYELLIFVATALTISVLAARRRDAQLTLEATVASIGDGVIVTDNDGRVSFLNTVAERLTGWRFKDAVKQPISRVFVAVHEETREPQQNPVERALRGGSVSVLAVQTLLVARDGSERPVADSAAPIRDANGATLGAVLVFRDASSQRQSELALRQQTQERQELLERERDARAEAERANRLKDEFLATLSHELRTPLNAVLGWSHMLTRRHLSSEQQKQALAAIYRNAQAQARLVDDVLDLSRIVTGRMALASEPVDVCEIVQSTADAFTPAVLGKRQELRLDLEADAEITGDPHRLRQIVWNLLSNATKFTPEGGAIAVHVARNTQHVQLTISDTGQGIEAAFLPFMFDRFRQADSSSTRGHGGLGLGLALVRHLVEAHGGHISATSEGPGKGTTIRIVLPAREPAPAPETDNAPGAVAL